jgi:hypothetical protein
MPIFNIDCEGETHRIEIDEEGDIYLHDHDADEELALVEIGEEPPECVARAMGLAEDPDDVLVESAQEGDLEGVKMALAAGANASADAEPLMWAADGGHADIVEILLANGARVHHAALRQAAKNGHTDIVRILLKAGANVYTGKDKSVALRLAAAAGHADIVRILLKAGANEHATNNEALLCAADNGHAETVKVLLEAGADVHVWNDAAIKWATKHDHTATIQVLEDWIAEYG